MLSVRMQIQFIADRLAGFPVEAKTKDFLPSLARLLAGIGRCCPGQEQQALEKVIFGLPERDKILQAILSARPGYRPPIPSLEELSKDLDAIEWVWAALDSAQYAHCPGSFTRAAANPLSASIWPGASSTTLDFLTAFQ